MAFPKIGLRAIMEMTGFNKGFRAYKDSVKDMEKKTEGSSQSISGVFKSLGKGILGFGVGAAAGIAGVGAAALKLAIDAAPIQGVGDAFRGLGGDIEALREGSLGLATDAELMKSFNSAASLVNKNFAEQLPDAMQFLSKVSASTGEDLNFMLDSLVKGIGRLSPAILDNLQVQVQLSDGTARATEMFGKQADQLDKAEEQAGLMAVVMKKLAENTADMPDITGTTATKMGQLQTKMANLKDEIGLMIADELPPLLDLLGDLVDDIGPKVIEWASGAINTIGDLVVTFGEWSKTLRDIGIIVDQESKKLGDLAITGGNVRKMALESINPLNGYKRAMDLISEKVGTQVTLSGALGVAWDLLRGKTIESIKETNVFASRMNALMLDAPLDPMSEALARVDAQLALSSEAMQTYRGHIVEVEGAFTTGLDPLNAMAFGISQFTPLSEESTASLTSMREVWETIFNAEAVQEAIGGVENIMREHAAAVAGIAESADAKQTEIDFSSKVKRQVAQVEFDAKMLQAEAEFQAKRAAIEATGDQVALAQLENAHARETAQAEQSFAEGQARSTFNEAVQQQIRERSQIVQQITQQKAFIAELENQKEFIRTTLEAAVIKAQNNGKISSEEAKLILGVVGKGQTQQLKNQELFTTEATRLANEWANGQIGAAKSTVLAYEQVQRAQDGQIKAAQIKLEELDQALEGFDLALPPLELPEFPSLPELDLGVDDAAGDAADAAADQATASSERIVASTVSAMAKAFDDAKTAITEIVGFEIPEGFDTGLDNLGSAITKMAQKFNAIWVGFQTEIVATAEVSPAIEAMGKAFNAFFGGIEKVGKFEMASGEDFINRLDAFVWALRVTGVKVSGWLKDISGEAREWLKESTPLAKNVKELFGVLGADISKIVASEDPNFEENVDRFFGQMRFVGVKISAWLKEIDEQSREALAEAVPVAENIGKLFGGIGQAISTVVDLAGLKDFEGVNMDVWRIIKDDIQTLLTDVSDWELSVDDEAIDSVIGKLGKLSAVVSNLSDIVIGVNEIAEVGGLDVRAARGILAQFNQLLAPGPAFSPLFPGLSAPEGSINPPATPAAGGGGGAGSLGTINIVGKFEGPTGDFVTFVQEFVLGTVTDILLGDATNPDYAT